MFRRENRKTYLTGPPSCMVLGMNTNNTPSSPCVMCAHNIPLLYRNNGIFPTSRVNKGAAKHKTFCSGGVVYTVWSGAEALEIRPLVCAFVAPTLSGRPQRLITKCSSRSTLAPQLDHKEKIIYAMAAGLFSPLLPSSSVLLS